MNTLHARLPFAIQVLAIYWDTIDVTFATRIQRVDVRYLYFLKTCTRYD